MELSAGETAGDLGSGQPDLLVRQVGQQDAPYAEEGAAQLQLAVRARVEPHVQVRRAVAPVVQVHPADPAESLHCPLHPADQRPELSRLQRRQGVDAAQALDTIQRFNAEQRLKSLRPEVPDKRVG